MVWWYLPRAWEEEFETEQIKLKSHLYMELKHTEQQIMFKKNKFAFLIVKYTKLLLKKFLQSNLYILQDISASTFPGLTCLGNFTTEKIRFWSSLKAFNLATKHSKKTTIENSVLSPCIIFWKSHVIYLTVELDWLSQIFF